MGICAFCYIGNLFSVVVLQKSMVTLEEECRVSLPWVYVHSCVCETCVV